MKYLLTADELAPKLRVSPSHLRRLARTGQVSCYRVGRRVLFVEEEVLQEVQRPRQTYALEPGPSCLRALRRIADEKAGSIDMP